MSSLQQQLSFQEAAKRFSRGFLVAPKRAQNRLGSEKLFRTLEGLTPKQLEVHDDGVRENGPRRLALCCTRRAGKSYLAAPWFVEMGMTAKNPETTMFFIAPTLEQAKALLWRRFIEVKRETGLEFEMKSDPWRIEFPTGAILYFRGAKDLDQLGQLRGFATKLAWVDEVQDVRDHVLRHIEASIGPSLRDNDGTLIISGTPGPICTGMWYEVSKGSRANWKVHEWSLFDNPHLPEKARDLETILREEGLTPDSPRFKREYMAQWVEDDSLLIYKYNAQLNGNVSAYGALPDGHDWQYSIGVDFGHSPDPSAVVVLAYATTYPTVHVIREWKKTKVTYTDLYEQGIKPFWEEFGPCQIVGDQSSKQAIAEINQRWGLGMQPSERQRKPAYIEMCNADMERGRILIPPEFALAKEMAELVWDPDKLPDRKEHPRRDNHLCDAFLYAWRNCRQWIGAKLPNPDPFKSEADMQAYHLSQLARRNTNAKPVDWASDADFYGNNAGSGMGRGSWGRGGNSW